MPSLSYERGSRPDSPSSSSLTPSFQPAQPSQDWKPPAQFLHYSEPNQLPIPLYQQRPLPMNPFRSQQPTQTLHPLNSSLPMPFAPLPTQPLSSSQQQHHQSNARGSMESDDEDVNAVASGISILPNIDPHIQMNSASRHYPSSPHPSSNQPLSYAGYHHHHPHSSPDPRLLQSRTNEPNVFAPINAGVPLMDAPSSPRDGSDAPTKKRKRTASDFYHTIPPTKAQLLEEQGITAVSPASHSGGESDKDGSETEHIAVNPDGTPRLPRIVQVEKQKVTTSATLAASASRRRSDALFKCPVPGCGSTFTRRFNLRGHLRSHTEERPYACDWQGCDKSFARKHDCNRHRTLHSTEAVQHTCAGCKKTFSRMDALNRHLRSEGGRSCRDAHSRYLRQLETERSRGNSKGTDDADEEDEGEGRTLPVNLPPDSLASSVLPH